MLFYIGKRHDLLRAPTDSESQKARSSVLYAEPVLANALTSTGQWKAMGYKVEILPAYGHGHSLIATAKFNSSALWSYLNIFFLLQLPAVAGQLECPPYCQESHLEY